MNDCAGVYAWMCCFLALSTLYGQSADLLAFNQVWNLFESEIAWIGGILYTIYSSLILLVFTSVSKIRVGVEPLEIE